MMITWRLFIGLLLIGMAAAAWADGFTMYGARSFNRIRETDQLAVVRLAPGRVTLDMFISIDHVPVGETITYVLPFWQRPEGFTMTAMTGDDFRKQCLRPLTPVFQEEIRRANRTALGQLPGAYVVGGFFAFAPLTPAGMLAMIAFPTFGRHRDRLSPYAVANVAAGSAELYRVSTTQDLHTLVARAGLPSRYAAVLQRYHTAYYAIVHLHGLAKVGDSAQGVYFRFTHKANGAAYTYTYPLGTGGAWAKPILLTEVYASCPDGYYLTATAPTLGTTEPYFALEQLAAELQYGDEPEDATSTFTSSLIPPMRYPTAWHRAYWQSNPTKDITLRLTKRPADPLFTVASFLRDSIVGTGLFIVLGFFGALLISVAVTVRNGWHAAGRPGCLWQHGRRFLLAATLPALATAILFLASMLLISIINDASGIGSTIILLAFLVGVPFLAIFLWRKLLPRADHELPAGTMERAAWMSALWYLLLLPVWLGVAWVLDAVVRG